MNVTATENEEKKIKHEKTDKQTGTMVLATHFASTSQ